MSKKILPYNFRKINLVTTLTLLLEIKMLYLSKGLLRSTTVALIHRYKHIILPIKIMVKDNAKHRTSEDNLIQLKINFMLLLKSIHFVCMVFINVAIDMLSILLTTYHSTTHAANTFICFRCIINSRCKFRLPHFPALFLLL